MASNSIILNPAEVYGGDLEPREISDDRALEILKANVEMFYNVLNLPKTKDIKSMTKNELVEHCAKLNHDLGSVKLKKSKIPELAKRLHDAAKDRKIPDFPSNYNDEGYVVAVAKYLCAQADNLVGGGTIPEPYKQFVRNVGTFHKEISGVVDRAIKEFEKCNSSGAVEVINGLRKIAPILQLTESHISRLSALVGVEVEAKNLPADVSHKEFVDTIAKLRETMIQGSDADLLQMIFQLQNSTDGYALANSIVKLGKELNVPYKDVLRSIDDVKSSIDDVLLQFIKTFGITDPKRTKEINDLRENIKTYFLNKPLNTAQLSDIAGRLESTLKGGAEELSVSGGAIKAGKGDKNPVKLSPESDPERKETLRGEALGLIRKKIMSTIKQGLKPIVLAMHDFMRQSPEVLAEIKDNHLKDAISSLEDFGKLVEDTKKIAFLPHALLNTKIKSGGEAYSQKTVFYDLYDKLVQRLNKENSMTGIRTAVENYIKTIESIAAEYSKFSKPSSAGSFVDGGVEEPEEPESDDVSGGGAAENRGLLTAKDYSDVVSRMSDAVVNAKIHSGSKRSLEEIKKIDENEYEEKSGMAVAIILNNLDKSIRAEIESLKKSNIELPSEDLLREQESTLRGAYEIVENINIMILQYHKKALSNPSLFKDLLTLINTFETTRRFITDDKSDYKDYIPSGDWKKNFAYYNKNKYLDNLINLFYLTLASQGITPKRSKFECVAAINKFKAVQDVMNYYAPWYQFSRTDEKITINDIKRSATSLPSLILNNFTVQVGNYDYLGPLQRGYTDIGSIAKKDLKRIFKKLWNKGYVTALAQSVTWGSHIAKDKNSSQKTLSIYMAEAYYDFANDVWPNAVKAIGAKVLIAVDIHNFVSARPASEGLRLVMGGAAVDYRDVLLESYAKLPPIVDYYFKVLYPSGIDKHEWYLTINPNFEGTVWRDLIYNRYIKWSKSGNSFTLHRVLNSEHEVEDIVSDINKISDSLGTTKAKDIIGSFIQFMNSRLNFYNAKQISEFLRDSRKGYLADEKDIDDNDYYDAAGLFEPEIIGKPTASAKYLRGSGTLVPYSQANKKDIDALQLNFDFNTTKRAILELFDHNTEILRMKEDNSGFSDMRKQIAVTNNTNTKMNLLAKYLNGEFKTDDISNVPINFIVDEYVHVLHTVTNDICDGKFTNFVERPELFTSNRDTLKLTFDHIKYFEELKKFLANTQYFYNLIKNKTFEGTIKSVDGLSDIPVLIAVKNYLEKIKTRIDNYDNNDRSVVNVPEYHLSVNLCDNTTMLIPTELNDKSSSFTTVIPKNNYINYIHSKSGVVEKYKELKSLKDAQKNVDNKSVAYKDLQNRIDYVTNNLGLLAFDFRGYFYNLINTRLSISNTRSLSFNMYTFLEEYFNSICIPNKYGTEVIFAPFVDDLYNLSSYQNILKNRLFVEIGSYTEDSKYNKNIFIADIGKHIFFENHIRAVQILSSVKDQKTNNYLFKEANISNINLEYKNHLIEKLPKIIALSERLVKFIELVERCRKVKNDTETPISSAKDFVQTIKSTCKQALSQLGYVGDIVETFPGQIKDYLRLNGKYIPFKITHINSGISASSFYLNNFSAKTSLPYYGYVMKLLGDFKVDENKFYEIIDSIKFMIDPLVLFNSNKQKPISEIVSKPEEHRLVYIKNKNIQSLGVTAGDASFGKIILKELYMLPFNINQLHTKIPLLYIMTYSDLFNRYPNPDTKLIQIYPDQKIINAFINDTFIPGWSKVSIKDKTSVEFKTYLSECAKLYKSPNYNNILGMDNKIIEKFINIINNTPAYFRPYIIAAIVATLDSTKIVGGAIPGVVIDNDEYDEEFDADEINDVDINSVGDENDAQVDEGIVEDIDGQPVIVQAADPAADGKAADPAADGKAADPAADGKAADPAADGKAADPAADGKAADGKAADGKAADGKAAGPDAVLIDKLQQYIEWVEYFNSLSQNIKNNNLQDNLDYDIELDYCVNEFDIIISDLNLLLENKQLIEADRSMVKGVINDCRKYGVKCINLKLDLSRLSVKKSNLDLKSKLDLKYLPPSSPPSSPSLSSSSSSPPPSHKSTRVKSKTATLSDVRRKLLDIRRINNLDKITQKINKGLLYDIALDAINRYNNIKISNIVHNIIKVFQTKNYKPLPSNKKLEEDVFKQVSLLIGKTFFDRSRSDIIKRGIEFLDVNASRALQGVSGGGDEKDEEEF